jgi:uncharacterized membrane protein YfcA
MIPASGFLIALIIGVSLGLLGSGGSILTVPVLVYLFRLNPVTGTAYSLFIVGATSLAGLLVHLRRSPVQWGPAVAFALPSLTGVYLVRGHVIHALPPSLTLPGAVEIPRDTFIMALFAAVMAAAGAAMLHRRPAGVGAADGMAPGSPTHRARLARIAVSGLAVGALTGFVGAGGGFLIVPVLVMMAGLPMKAAVGDSLAIITAQSFLGFAADWRFMEGIDWGFLAGFSALSIAGAVVGGLLGRRLDGARLRSGFGAFLLLLATAILVKEIFLKGPL